MEQSATPWRVFDAPSTGDASVVAAGDDPAARPQSPAAARQHDTRSTKLAIAGVAGAIVIGAIAVAVALGAAGGQVVDAPDNAIQGSNDTALLAGAGDIVVNVTGAVVRPGVYRLPPGSRISDAIDAAGGFSPRVAADTVGAALNLAATIADGAHVHVPSRDDPSTSGGGSSAGGTGGGTSRVNVNTATQAELEALPGIGPVTATKIMESRSAAPFTSIEQLRERKLVGEKAFSQLESLVSVD